MPRTNLTRRGVREPLQMVTKLTEHDTALDALETLTGGLPIDFKGSVKVSSTANLTLSGEQTIDGVAASAGDRILVKDQSAGAENGIYVVASGAWTRATDADTSAEVTTGLFVHVSQGTVGADSWWVLTTNDAITLGSTALVFTKLPTLAEFASTAAGKGASLVGINDTGTLITATTVEAALQEFAAASWVTAGRIADGILTGAKVAVVADDAVIGGIEVSHVCAVPDGVTGNVDVVLTHKTEITHIEVIKAGGAGGASDTLQVKNGTDVITNAMDINVADKTVVRPTTVDDAFTTIAAGGTLRFTRTKASAANVACRVIVRGVRRT